MGAAAGAVEEGLGTAGESKDYQVLAAYDGKEGLERVRRENPDLVILDIIMP